MAQSSMLHVRMDTEMMVKNRAARFTSGDEAFAELEGTGAPDGERTTS